jgi:hypothetical protein
MSYQINDADIQLSSVCTYIHSNTAEAVSLQAPILKAPGSSLGPHTSYSEAFLGFPVISGKFPYSALTQVTNAAFYILSSSILTIIQTFDAK